MCLLEIGKAGEAERDREAGRTVTLCFPVIYIELYKHGTRHARMIQQAGLQQEKKSSGTDGITLEGISRYIHILCGSDGIDATKCKGDRI